MVDIKKLKDFSIFKHLNERELEQIAGIAEEVSFKKDLRIFEEKALAVNLYLVLKGKVELKVSGNGKEKIVIDTAEPGDIFGWSAVTDPHTFTAAAWTTEDSEFIVLGSEHLISLFDKNNHIGYRIIKEIATVASRRVKALEQKLADIIHAK